MGVTDRSLTPMSIQYVHMLFLIYSSVLNVSKAVFLFSFLIMCLSLASGSSGCFQCYHLHAVGCFSQYKMTSDSTKPALKICSWNVGGIHNPIKRKKILSFLKKEGAHIALLQETHLSAN